MWDLILSVPDHCFYFYLFTILAKSKISRLKLVSVAEQAGLGLSKQISNDQELILVGNPEDMFSRDEAQITLN